MNEFSAIFEVEQAPQTEANHELSCSFGVIFGCLRGHFEGAGDVVDTPPALENQS